MFVGHVRGSGLCVLGVGKVKRARQCLMVTGGGEGVGGIEVTLTGAKADREGEGDRELGVAESEGDREAAGRTSNVEG